MTITPLHEDEIDDRDLVVLSERVRAVALRVPAAIPLVEQLLRLLNDSSLPSDTAENMIEFVRFCREYPEVALLLARITGMLAHCAQQEAGASETESDLDGDDWPDEPTLPGGPLHANKLR